MKELLDFLLETVKMALLAFLIVFPIRYFIFQPFVVSGNSMHPSFEDRDYLLIDEISFRFREPQRGEVIIFKAPLQPSARYIKRIIGLPGETVKIYNGNVYILKNDAWHLLDERSYLPQEAVTANGVEIKLEQGQYFVMGDNRMFSSDSRSWGPLPEDNIIGRAFFRALPFAKASTIERPSYHWVEEGAFLSIILAKKF